MPGGGRERVGCGDRGWGEWVGRLSGLIEGGLIARGLKGWVEWVGVINE